MRRFKLHVDEIIQGEFTPKKLNLLLIFQVNCPGCFTYALPTFNELFKKYKSQLGILALSTAFEDFDLNSKENTELLIHQGELIGETKKALLQQGIEKLPYELQFPIGMDSFLQPNQKEKLVETICLIDPNFQIWSDYDKDLLRKKVLIYLQNQQKTPMTFTANQFRGTPTIVLFNEQNELLFSWFGHQPLESIVGKVESQLLKV